MQSDRVFEQLFALVRHQINQGIGAEGQHPIAWQPIQKCADAEDDRAHREQGLNHEDSSQAGKADWMLEHCRESPSIDFLLSRQLRFEHQPVSKERTVTELSDKGLPRFPDPWFGRLRQEPLSEPGSTLV